MADQPNTIRFRRPYSKHTELSFTGVLTVKTEDGKIALEEPIARNYVYDFIQQCKKDGATTGGTYSMNGDIDMKITGQRRVFHVIYKVGPQKPRNDFNLNFENIIQHISQIL